MAFLKKLFGGDAGKATQIEPPPTRKTLTPLSNALRKPSDIAQ